MSEITINAALRRLGYDRTTLTAHGFRGMAATMLHECGWPSDVIERQLSHSERNAVKAAYNHAEHLPERRKMMQSWANYLDGLRRETAAPLAATAIQRQPTPQRVQATLPRARDERMAPSSAPMKPASVQPRP